MYATEALARKSSSWFMLWARYLSRAEWQALAGEAGYRIAARAQPQGYRAAPYTLAFPNRLEVTMRFDPV